MKGEFKCWKWRSLKEKRSTPILIKLELLDIKTQTTAYGKVAGKQSLERRNRQTKQRKQVLIEHVSKVKVLQGCL